MANDMSGNHINRKRATIWLQWFLAIISKTQK
uniref:Uncharacterized protein n=1 Tax=Anguilla anguilla TaxID=7936 RepID=A0A0E9SNW4_ANGAN